MSGAVPYDRLLAVARRHARTREEAEDLVQSAVLAALESGRRDFGDDRVAAWLAGTLRWMGAMAARGAGRRRRREAEFARRSDLWEAEDLPVPDPAGLPPALARTARLIAAGCTRAEICWLLGLDPSTLRQRLSALRRVAVPGAPPPEAGPAPGPLRQALLGPVRRLPDATLASADPDGHLFSVGRSRKAT